MSVSVVAYGVGMDEVVKKRVVVFVPSGEHRDWKVAAAGRGVSVSELVCWRMRTLPPDESVEVRGDPEPQPSVVSVFDEGRWRKEHPEPPPSDRLRHRAWAGDLVRARGESDG